jgi:hypothetical protein
MANRNRNSTVRTALLGAVLASAIPDYERQVIQSALNATFNKADNDQFLGVPLVTQRRIVEILRTYSKKCGNAFALVGTQAWKSQLGRWLAGNVFPDYVVTRMGVMRRVDAEKLSKKRPSKSYITRVLSYTQPTTNAKQSPQSQPAKKAKPTARRRVRPIEVASA